MRTRMGLDWFLERKVVEGYETEHKNIKDLIEMIDGAKPFDEINAFLDTSNIHSDVAAALKMYMIESNDPYNDMFDILSKREDEITVVPCVTAKCPRVGYDEEANEWILNFGRNSSGDRDKIIQEYYGEYVPKLANDEAFFPLLEDIRGLSLHFRARAIGYHPLLPQDLTLEAYNSMTPTEMIDYANRLESAMDTIDFSTEESDYQKDVIVKAIRWLKYWGSKGHALYASY